MAQRSTRNKIRFQVASAFDDLRKAQIHLNQAAALADDRSPEIDDYLPEIVTALETVIKATDALYERL